VRVEIVKDTLILFV